MSDLAQSEVERAPRLLDDPSSEKRVIPILLKIADIPPRLRRLQYIHFRQSMTDPEPLLRLFEALGARKKSFGVLGPTRSIQKIYYTGIIRRLLNEALDSDDFDAFVYDYFRPWREGLDAGETKKGKIQFLIESLEQTGELDRLLDLMARDHPTVYRRYVDLL